MKPLASIFANLLGGRDQDMSVRRQITREWESQRARAMSPSERAEIDAIFSRHM